MAGNDITIKVDFDIDELIREAKEKNPNIIEVVRCKDCKNYGQMWRCPMMHIFPLGKGLSNFASEDNYCGWAEEKETES